MWEILILLTSIIMIICFWAQVTISAQKKDEFYQIYIDKIKKERGWE